MARRIGGMSACFSALAVLMAGLAARGADATLAAEDGQSVIACFDMTEPYQPLPRGFSRVHGEGFYHWIKIELDRQVGHGAPPSIRIDLRRGNGGCEQQYDRVRVRTHFNYQVEAYVRTAGLTRARAYVTAFFCDAFGKKIPSTVQVSPLLGGGQDAGWQRVVLLLRADDPRYRYISFGLWLTQPWTVPGADAAAARTGTEDISGTAWFDDVRIRALPNVRLFTSSACNVFVAAEQPSVLAEISGLSSDALQVDLAVQDAAGAQIARRQTALVRANEQVHRLALPLKDLPGGWYAATLSLADAGRVVGQRQVAFVKLAEPTGRGSRQDQQFGIVLAGKPPDGERSAEILGRLGVGRCKLALWRADQTADEVMYLQSDLASTLMALARRQVRCVGVFADAPQIVSDRFFRRIESMVDVFAARPENWKDPLAITLTYYAPKISQWQLGADDDGGYSDGSDTATALAQLTPQFTHLVARPQVGLPWAGTCSTAGAELAGADFLALRLDAGCDPPAVERVVADAVANAGEGRDVWATLDPIPAAGYRRAPRLIRFARRAIAALVGGARGVYIPQPWQDLSDAEGGPRPDELVVVYHVLADQLGGARFMGRLRLGEHVQCYVFDRGEDALLIGWVDSGPAEEVATTLYLGGQARCVDLWGRTAPVDCQGGQATVRFGETPVFISGIDARIARLRDSFRMTPATIDSDFVTHEGEVEFVNGFEQTITGTLWLNLPAGWTLTPQSMRFALAPGAKFSRRITLRFPYNASAGGKVLTGRFQVDAERSYAFTAETPFSLELAGCSTRLFARIVGRDVLVDLALSNFRDDARQFDCVAMAPGQATQQRSIGALARGQTAVKRFLFPGAAAALAGKAVRVTLREIDGSHVANYEAVVR